MRFIPVGRVVSAHGVKGEIKFRYYNEDAAASLQYPSFFAEENGAKRELKPLRVRPLAGSFLIKLEGLETADEVRFLLDRELFVREDDLAPLGEDEYYDYQLIGLVAVTEKDRLLGKVVEVMHTKANDILVVRGAAEALVPMTGDHIVQISMKEGLVRIREDGLVE
jgi:16S rRNA processing protein RimM